MALKQDILRCEFISSSFCELCFGFFISIRYLISVAVNVQSFLQVDIVKPFVGHATDTGIRTSIGVAVAGH
jgi:hypothetical protein